MMIVFGAIALAAFATPLMTEPMAFNWDLIIDGPGKAKIPPLVWAGVGLLSIVFAAIPMVTLPRGALATVLGLAGAFTPFAVSASIGDPLKFLQFLGALVLVPGLAGSWRLVLPLARRLAKHYEVITYGLRGDGLPSAGFVGPQRRVWDMSAHGDDLASLISHLGLECPAVLGVSFGGAVALQTAVDHPSCLGALIVQGADAKFRTSIGTSVAPKSTVPATI